MLPPLKEEPKKNKTRVFINEGLQIVGQDLQKIFQKRPKKKKGDDGSTFESIDQIKVHSIAAKAKSKQIKEGNFQLKRRAVYYWLLCTFIGIGTGICAYLSHQGLSGIQGIRISISRYFMTLPGVYGAVGMFLGWLTYSLSGLAVVMVGTLLCVYVQPPARGSGIAEIKAFLNGVAIPGLFQLRTLLIKLIAVICAVGGGLCVGQEGPMIHIGAMVGYNMSQMKFSSIPRVSKAFRKFQNDRDKRDFVTSGASAGVSAAFSAPIGGTLFGLEEASSFWSHQLIWRSFFGCMVATWTANFLIGGSKLGIWEAINQPSHVMYRVALGQGYRLYEIVPFLLVGVIGGLLGALFIKLNLMINSYRKKKYYTKNKNKVIELAVVVVLTATLSILLPLAFQCQESSLLHTDDSTVPVSEEAEEALVFEIYNCDAGKYNPLASLSFTSAELALKHLFVREKPTALGFGPLLTFFIMYYSLACFTAGTWIAAGLLVPMLIMGASWGRLFGVILSMIFPDAQFDPGIYALLGAAAFMGGVTRMTISLVVIMLEITNDLDALLPIMLVALVAKWVGDSFGHSLYDIQLHVGNVPFLEADPPHRATIMTCKDAMSTGIPVVNQMETVEVLVKVVSDPHGPSTIPVIDKGPEGKNAYMLGSIPMHHIRLLLLNKAFESQDYVDVVSVQKFKKEPKFNFTEDEQKKFLDLTPYINMATFVVQASFPLNMGYRIFRTYGLRQLYVVDHHNNLVGCIERENLLIHDTVSPHGHHEVKPQQEAKGLLTSASEEDLQGQEAKVLDLNTTNNIELEVIAENDAQKQIPLDEQKTEKLE